VTAFPITLTISLCLAFTFVLFFLCERLNGRKGSAEHDSLLPLADESPRLARVECEGDEACKRGCRCGDCSNRPARP
jgi:hypothetical protein